MDHTGFIPSLPWIAPFALLLLGIASITVPWDTLLTSVVLYIVIPVIFLHQFHMLPQAWSLVIGAFVLFNQELARGAVLFLPGADDHFRIPMNECCSHLRRSPVFVLGSCVRHAGQGIGVSCSRSWFRSCRT